MAQNNPKKKAAKKKKKAGDAPSAPDRADVFELTELEQVRVLSDPLRVRILEALCADPRTTKQVAEELGEKPTRLYHHVEALERVGVIRLVETRQNRGTIEKYYSAVARMFRPAPGLFRADDPDAGPALDAITGLFDNTSRELRELVRAGHDFQASDEAVLSYVELRGSERQLHAVKDKLMQLLEEVATLPETDGEERRYRLTLAYYPLDVASPAA